MKQYANVSNTNSKLGGQILSINMPAGITCRPYDEELDKKLEHAKEMEEFYSELARKLKEVL